MDDWGDPWANDADPDATLPKPVDVAITNKPVFSTAPVLLNSFLDDAQWGSAEDEGFGGGWESSSGNTELVQPTHPDAREADLSTPLSAAQLPDATYFYQGEKKRAFEVEDEGWGSLAYSEEALEEVDNIISENSDSATTIQPDDDSTRVPSESLDTPHLDDEISTLSSTSPSEVSHAEAPPIESPRTSSEDERIAVTALEARQSPHEQEEKTENEFVSLASQVEPAGSKEVEDDDFGDFEEDIQETSTSDDVGKVVVTEAPLYTQASREKENEPVPGEESRYPPAAAPAGIVAWKLDQPLMDQLFPTPEPSKELSKTIDEPISTTSTRKTWYRLTRKPTMREYNTGMDNDNYVRVTWANSHIRAEAKKIVVRWTAEDRNSGRGRSSGASFYWDQYSSNARNTHVRKKSIISDSARTQPAENKLQPLSTNVPAAFNWSSSPLADGPRPIASPVAAKHSAIPEIQAQANRPVSIDLTPRTPTLETPKLPVSTAPDHEQPMKSDPRKGLSNLDTSLHTRETDTTFDEDDDDWGEMVVSPTMSTTPPTENFSQTLSHDQTFSTHSTAPKSVRSSPFQPPASRHPSPIVRLKSAVSPTSSAFRFNSFVPVGAEVEPIGQTILKKSVHKATDLTPVKGGAEPASVARTEETFSVENQRSVITREESDDLSAFESSTVQSATNEPNDFSAFKSPIAPPEPSKPDDLSTFKSSTFQPVPAPEPVQSETPPISTMGGFANTSRSAPPAQAPIDAWSDADSKNPIIPAPAPAPAEDTWSTADFSFFESTTPAPQPHNPLSPSDPWSVFNTPVPDAPLAHLHPRETTVTPSPNLTYEQRRKAEEDSIIAGIVRGLPDLGYMLR